MKTYDLPCPSIPIPLTLEHLKSTIFTTCLQRLRPGFMTKVGEVVLSLFTLWSHFKFKVHEVKVAVMQKLAARGDMEFAGEWKEWFDKLPKNSAETHESYYNVLGHLSLNHSGVYVKPTRASLKSYLVGSDYVDPITFTGGPVSKDERVSLLTSIGMYTPFVVSKEDQYRKNIRVLGEFAFLLTCMLQTKSCTSVAAGYSPEEAEEQVRYVLEEAVKAKQAKKTETAKKVAKGGKPKTKKGSKNPRASKSSEFSVFIFFNIIVFIFMLTGDSTKVITTGKKSVSFPSSVLEKHKSVESDSEFEEESSESESEYSVCDDEEASVAENASLNLSVDTDDEGDIIMYYACWYIVIVL